MSISSQSTSTQASAVVREVPLLENGDQLTRPEFERRYEAMRHLKKAELIAGVVYMPSPVRYEGHGREHFALNAGWSSTRHRPLESRLAITPQSGWTWTTNPQPDVLLRITNGGQSHVLLMALSKAPLSWWQRLLPVVLPMIYTKS